MKPTLFPLAMLIVTGCTRGPSGSDTGTDTAIVATDSATEDTDTEDTDTEDTDTEDTDTEDTDVEDPDADSDGSPASEDCDDNDASSYPGADELCDGVDNNCDGTVDNDATDTTTFYADADGDGFGTDVTEQGCEAPTGYVAETNDCDDERADVFPGATEDNCADPVDYNCDGSTGFADVDGDGSAACEDCDDDDATSLPGGSEICDGADNDCNETIDDNASDASTFYLDADGDGAGDPNTTETGCAPSSGYVTEANDCNDQDADESPTGTEVCDGKDNDCSGDADGDDATDKTTFYADTDGDGEGDPNNSTETCNQPTDTVLNADDCNDADADEFSGGTEVCDGKDNDCSGDADGDDATDRTTWYTDADSDGAGAAGTDQLACDAPDGTVDNDDDCNDSEAGETPGKVEVPFDGLDNDCADGDDTDELIYVSDRSNGKLYAVNRDDGTKAWEASYGTAGIDLTVGPDGTIYVGGYGNGALYKVDPSDQSVSTLVASGLNGVHGLEYDYENDVILAAATGLGRVISIDPSDGTLTDLTGAIGGVGLIGAMRLPGEERIWIADRSNARLMVFDPSDNSTTEWAKLPISPNLFVHDGNGGFYLTATNGVVHVDPRLGRVRLLGRTGIGSYGGCADPMGDGLILGDHSSRIHTFDVSDGTVTPFSVPLGTTWGCATSVTRDADGDGFVNSRYGGADCNDADASINPDATDDSTDGIDNNCDFVDGIDADGDGDAAASGGGTDCDDSDPAVFVGTSGCDAAASCEHIRQTVPTAPDGVYTINPGGNGEVDAYCDMTTDGGGWTRVVNVKGNSIFHADQADAVGDVSDAAAAAKLSDDDITALTVGGYWRWTCGPSKNVFVRNAENTWTSAKSNNLDWSMDNNKDGTFECAANRNGYVFSDHPVCSSGHTNYAASAGSAEGNGCYHTSTGWNQDGTLWAR